ncbi:hypothetical protein GTK63_05505 [Lactobacillus crispatus]|uniref:Uncharacterized protein n=1 Tax=Lactobacillus crispatus TaxID=47770 RepID=A0A7X4KS74_9LACO|nr:hypothetical protein [Lactobacillus crispatus]MYN53780.1 hypothetical protein [Lactobacillus crispatus]
MNTEKTLKEFIDEQIHDHNLPNTEQMQKKIRIKLIRTLTDPALPFEQKKVWENAEVKKIEGKQNKILSSAVLKQLQDATSPYFDNLAKENNGLTTQEIEERKKKIFDSLSNYEPDYASDDEERLHHAVQDYIKKIQKEAILKAIFEHFYTPIDTQKIVHDMSYSIFSADHTDSIPEDERLSHPEGNYYKKLPQKK